MAERIFLHVGTPKSGTTYLQAVLWQNADALKSEGLLLPGRFKTHYAAAKGVTSRTGMKREIGVDIQQGLAAAGAAGSALGPRRADQPRAARPGHS